MGRPQLASDAWKLLDALTETLGEGHPRDVDAESLAKRALEVLGEFVGARSTSIYVADLLGALNLAATSRNGADHPLPRRVELMASPSQNGDSKSPVVAKIEGCPVLAEPERDAHEHPAEQLDPKVSLMVAAARASAPLFLTDVGRFRTNAGLAIPTYANGLGQSCIVLPLVQAGEIYGVANLANLSRPVPEVDSESRHALLIAARLLAQSLAGAHAIADLNSRATRDGLTSLYNYATLYDLLAREVLRAGRYKTPLTILLMDLDGFKKINDHYGHLAGDRILSDLAARIRATKRGPDLAARYAGDEFALVLPETHLEGAREVAKRLSAAIADEAFAFLKTEIRATLSIGIAEYKSGMTAVDLVRKADENLYEAKRAGKNAICG